MSRLTPAATVIVTHPQELTLHYTSSSILHNSFVYWIWIRRHIDTSVSYSSVQQSCLCLWQMAWKFSAPYEVTDECGLFSFLDYFFPLLTPLSVTTSLLQVADESKQQCSEQWDNCHSFFYTHTLCVCVFVYWGFAGLVAVSFFIVSSAIISRLLWKMVQHARAHTQTWITLGNLWTLLFPGWDYC